ncbi:transposon Ty3-G Gag-Pol polyprotein [Trichonephila clavipes]|nr:transposon Ty3-G Gag-Pol polyprotein [Trichonephila clavipes]
MQRRSESHNVTDSLLLELFLQQLPPNAQSILASIQPLTGQKASLVGDRILEVTPVQEVKELRRSRSFSRNRFDSRNRGKSPKPKASNLCWYHNKFATKARKCIQPCSFQENLERAGVAATYALPSTSCRLFVNDRKSNICFLVDTGSDCSILPANKTLKQSSPVQTFIAANGTPIQQERPIQFLGCQVSSEGISPLPDRVDAIQKSHTNKKKSSLPSKNLQTPLEWTEEVENSFTAAKTALADATLLKHPIPGATLSVWTDASNFAIDIRYVVGTENKLADALSRVEIDAIIKPPILDYKKFAQTQLHDSEIHSFLKPDSSIKLEKQYFPLEEISIYCGKSLETPQPFVPENLRQVVFSKSAFSIPILEYPLQLI